MEVILILLAYLFVVNLVNFILMGVDKRKAQNHDWRIPEITFFIWALMGGALGGILGMYTFRHKTRHAKFVFGLPVIGILELIAVIAVICLMDLSIKIM